MQLRSRAASGTCAIAASGIVAVKHQQVEAPAASPQSLAAPHSGQMS